MIEMMDNLPTHSSDTHLLLTNPWLYTPGDIFTFSGRNFHHYVWKHKNVPVHDEMELQKLPGTNLHYEYSYFRDERVIDFVLLKHKQSNALKSKLFLKCLNPGFQFSDHIICLKAAATTNTDKCSINGDEVIKKRFRKLDTNTIHPMEVVFYALLKNNSSVKKA